MLKSLTNSITDRRAALDEISRLRRKLLHLDYEANLVADRLRRELDAVKADNFTPSREDDRQRQAVLIGMCEDQLKRRRN